VNTLEWIVLVVASGIALLGVAVVVWRELAVSADPSSRGRLRLAAEVFAPAIGLFVLIVWLWTG